ncbi:MAG: hypothetical protein IJF25_06650, partial [Oscillospiraceae bacterium]|nr:hypothetical protein [Oscillospiraceae bacterium]
KTLLATIFIGIPFLVREIMKPDRSIIWICIWIYLVVNGFIISFSQEAYDADVKKANDTKALYRKIFGRFAPIAPNIPMILLILCAVMVYIFPVTKLLRIITGVVFFLIIAYVLWFWWIVREYKHKQLEPDIKEQNDEK